ncbi:MAG: CBS domain-containing protein [Planctomycetota bacterium]|nr:CBS domain-containing protein [Planctomycetota bacterium]
MQLRDILANKGHTIHSIRPSASLEEAIQTLVRNNCGSLLVCDEADCRRMVGILTERDVLRACAEHRGPLNTVEVADVMTIEVITGTPNDSLEETMGLMTENRIRHLPVLEDEQLVGMISIGDLVKAHYDFLSLENHYLKSYLHG